MFWVLVRAHNYILLSDGTSVVLVDAILITNRPIHLVLKSLLPWIVSEKLLLLLIPRLLIPFEDLAHVIINHLRILTLDIDFRGRWERGLVRVLATGSPSTIACHET